MLDDERDTTDHPTSTDTGAAGSGTSGTAGTSGTSGTSGADAAAGAAEPAAPRKRTRKKAAAPAATTDGDTAGGDGDSLGSAPAGSATESPKKATAPRKRARKATPAVEVETDGAPTEAPTGTSTAPPAVPSVLFQAPEPAAPARKRARKKAAAAPAGTDAGSTQGDDAQASAAAATPPAPQAATSEPGAPEAANEAESGEDAAATTGSGSRRRRGRRGRGRAGTETGEAAADEAGEAGEGASGAEAAGSAGAGDARAAAQDKADTADRDADDADGDADAADGETGEGGTRRRRRRRRRRSGDGAEGEAVVDEDGVPTVVHVREPKPAKTAKSSDDDVKGVKGSTRLEAKRQRRRDGRDSGRRRPPVISEAEFLARRESVDRVMVVRQGEERTQIAVLEDGMLVEHYVARKDHTSMVGNVYLGKVQNVLPSMEAAFVDIGRGRNAVLYAGEVNYDASALEGKAPRIEQALKSGQSVLVQVTKDPIGHKGARLTSQVSLPGRYMVYVPDGRLSGISRKLPDTERSRLKGILKRLMPEEAGVIIRTAAEGASEDDLERDLKRLQAQWADIDKKAQTASAPSMIYGEPDVVIRVIRDIFNEDFKELVVSGADEWDTVDNYVRWVAPDLAERARRWTEDEDVFAAYRIDEQLAKALDRKVWLPSGGYLVIDRTEAMVVVDVNTGKFTGKGGNLEAAEEIVRQLRLRDLGGIIVIDFIDMVLESNRDLVLRRLIECLGRDRTRHQVAEVTSLGLVQMTRKRVGQGLVEAFSEPCKECGGRGIKITHDPIASKRPPAQKQASGGESSGSGEDKPKRSRRGRGGGGSSSQAADSAAADGLAVDSPADDSGALSSGPGDSSAGDSAVAGGARAV